MGKVLAQQVCKRMPLEQRLGTKLDLSGPTEDAKVTCIPCAGTVGQE